MSAEPRTRARSLSYLFVAGALVAAILLGTFLPHPDQPTSQKPVIQPSLVANVKPAPVPKPALDSPQATLSPKRTSAPTLDLAAGRPQRDLLIEAYHEWGRQHPEPAFLSATQIPDPAARQIAIQSALSGWARTDPEGLAKFALARPDGPEKTDALTKAMRAWLHRDPWKAGDWIAAHESTIAIAEKMFRDDRR